MKLAIVSWSYVAGSPSLKDYSRVARGRRCDCKQKAHRRSTSISLLPPPSSHLWWLPPPDLLPSNRLERLLALPAGAWHTSCLHNHRQLAASTISPRRALNSAPSFLTILSPQRAGEIYSSHVLLARELSQKGAAFTAGRPA